MDWTNSPWIHCINISRLRAISIARDLLEQRWTITNLHYLAVKLVASRTSLASDPSTIGSRLVSATLQIRNRRFCPACKDRVPFAHELQMASFVCERGYILWNCRGYHEEWRNLQGSETESISHCFSPSFPRSPTFCPMICGLQHAGSTCKAYPQFCWSTFTSPTVERHLFV